MKQYFVYIMTSNSGKLYTGMTNDLQQRVDQHKDIITKGSAGRNGVNRLVYFEIFGSVRDAIAREKQIQDWGKNQKLALVESANPRWQDLSAEWS